MIDFDALSPQQISQLEAVGYVPKPGSVVAKHLETIQATIPVKPTRHGNKPTIYNGVRYMSKAEAARAQYHDEAAKSWIDGYWWLPQVKFRLGCPENTYTCDFLVVEPGSGRDKLSIHVEDVKGHETDRFRWVRKLWVQYGPCELWVIKGKQIEVVNGGAAR